MAINTVTNENLLNLLEGYGLSEEADAYARETLLEEPSREVGQYTRTSVVGAYSSPSQGRTIQFESHTAELAWLLRWELDPDIIGFRDQPPMVQIKKADKNGVMRSSVYTPDFLLFLQNEILVVEVKTQKNISELSDKYPKQWSYSNGVWSYIPAEDAFRKKGLVHKVFSIDTTQSIETNNLKTLVHALRMSDGVCPGISSQLLSELDECAWLSLKDLRAQVPESTYADIYFLIVTGKLFVNLQNYLLTDSKSCIVASDSASLSISEQLRWEAPAVPKPIATRSVPSKVELQAALVRLERANSDYSSRHARRLRKKVREGTELGISPLQAMIMPRRGNSQPRLPPKVKECVQEHIEAQSNPKIKPKSEQKGEPTFRPIGQSKVYATWVNYKRWAKDKHPDFNPVSLNTYRRFFLHKSDEKVAFSKGGKRAANAAASTTPVLDRSLVASRPFERVSVDHTKLKILPKICESNGQEYTRKPWLSALVDESSGYWMSFFLTFRDPSRASLSMLFRNCVREYGRLPEYVHSDRGSDFTSTYFKGFAAHFGITHSLSPAGHSRFNSPVERVNKQIKDQWISHRAGNTINYKETRGYSKGYRPQDQASLSIDDLFVEIEAFRNLYNQTIVGTQSESPEKLFNSGLEAYNFSGIPTEFDDDFLLVTAIDTKKQDYKISRKGDIMYNELHFHHPELRRLLPKKNRIELRFDPEDPYRIYCQIEDNWITVLNAGYKKFVAKTTVARWAETLRVAEGRSLRDEAKEDGHEIKALAIEEFEATYDARKAAELAAESQLLESPDNHEHDEPGDIYERLKRNVLENLGATSQ